ncbi:uncharacterized protein LOC141643764 [Silene latifolia]|uniref:uncharacterized protein LOC141643764 n=1 Tax=Silene latifolia TaxID=37657 RepID=UPI003D76C8CF
MASTTELDDAEFWLPSHFLTDDDILSDFGFGSGSGSSSTEPETSDDDDHLLTRPFSTSPQSTLFGCDRLGSSPGSPTGPVQVDDDDVSDKTATLELLNKAAGEVAKIKLTKNTTGTGFFDCSNTAKKGLFCPPPLPQFTPPFYSHPHFPRFPPHMMRGPIQLPQPPPQQQQNRVTNNNNNKNNGNNRPLGLPPSAWPPLPGQTQAQAQAQAQTQGQAQPMMGMFVAPQRDSVGTGVFLPRGVATTAQPKKKSDGKATKTKNNKSSQRQNNARPAKANEEVIGLPSEWVY